MDNEHRNIYANDAPGCPNYAPSECIHSFLLFVPYRIIHDNWQNFITGGPDGKNNTVLPYFRLPDTSSHLLPGHLADYLGVSLFERSTGEHININSLPFRAYQLIWNEYYRDQNLQAPIEIPLTDGQKQLMFQAC